MSLSIQTLPVEIVYRILDHLNEKHLFMSISNVCQRLNLILHSYRRYQVNNIISDNDFLNENKHHTHIPCYLKHSLI